MNRIILGALVLVLFCSVCQAIELNSIDGNYWARSTYREKAEIVVSLTKAISVSDEKILVSPEKALNLCLLTDQYYSDNGNMKNTVLNAWLEIARREKAEDIVAN